MTEITRVSPFNGDNSATLDAPGGVQLALGGGHLTGPVIVQKAGAADAIVQLYDGTGTAGAPLLVGSGAATGNIGCASPCFADGLFVEIATASTIAYPTIKLTFTGNVPPAA